MPTLHIYPAYGPGYGTPRVYVITVPAGATVGDVLGLLGTPAAHSRDHVFDAVSNPRFREKYADIVVHSDILHPAL